MKRHIFSAALLVGGIVLGLSLPESIRAQVPGYVTKQVFKTDLVNLPGQEVIIYASDWPSGFRLPLHQHGRCTKGAGLRRPGTPQLRSDRRAIAIERERTGEARCEE